jgi:hypothetical protein
VTEQQSMQDPLYYLGMSSDSNRNDEFQKSFGISMLPVEQDFQSPRKEPKHKKTSTFANIFATPFGAQDSFLVSESSLQMLDIF